jgi:hypothetical protein
MLQNPQLLFSFAQGRWNFRMNPSFLLYLIDQNPAFAANLRCSAARKL